MLCTSKDVDACMFLMHKAIVGWGNLMLPNHTSLETSTSAPATQHQNDYVRLWKCEVQIPEYWLVHLFSDSWLEIVHCHFKTFTVWTWLGRWLANRFVILVEIPLKTKNRLRTWTWRSQHIWLVRTSTKALYSMQLCDYKIRWPQTVNKLSERQTESKTSRLCTM